MPALCPTDYYGEIVWLGAVMQRQSIEIDTQPMQTLKLGWDGVAGAAHSGRTRPSDSRVLSQHSQNTEIANVRQLALICADEMQKIAAPLGLEDLNPEWLGASVVIKGLPDFSHIPPSARLQAENGTTLVVDMQNFPCHQVGKTIERDRAGHGIKFKQYAKGLRGVTAWIERPGELKCGDKLRLHAPMQRAWQPLA